MRPNNSLNGKGFANSQQKEARQKVWSKRRT